MGRVGSVPLYTLPGNDKMGVNEDTYPVVPKTVPKCVGFGTDVNCVEPQAVLWDDWCIIIRPLLFRYQA